MSSSHPGRRGARRVALRLFVSCLSLLLVFAALPLATTTTHAQDDALPTERARASKNNLIEFVPGEIIVRFRTEAIADTKEQSIAPLRSQGLEIPVDVQPFLEEDNGEDFVEGLRLARVAPEETMQAIQALNARSDVLYAEPNYIWRRAATPNDPRFGEQYGLQRISAPQAWDITTGSRNVVVGVIDGGIDINHPDLQANIWRNQAEANGTTGVDDDGNGFIDDINGYDFHNNDATVYDSPTIDDHGTHVAGTIGAVGNNGVGVTGVNWQVSIISLKVLGSATGSGSTSNIIRSYQYAKTMRDLWFSSGGARGANIRVLNNSYGGPGRSQSSLDAILALNNTGPENERGILFVAAAGNDATDNFNFPHYPSNYDAPNVLAVASTNTADSLSGFSNFGARVVSMGAPGSGILSTTPNNTYTLFSGTSMATPHVAGAAALVLAANPNLNVQQLRGVLAFSGDVLDFLKNNTTTGRRLNVRASINSALEQGGGVDTIAPAPVANLEIIQQFTRQINLRWIAPGDDGNSGTVSDYDIFFIYPNGTRLLLPVPNGIYSSTTPVGFAPAGGTQSALVMLPYLNFSGTVEVRAYDNAGNFSTANLSVAVPQNPVSDPYTPNLTPSNGLVGGGTPLNLIGDDVFRENYQLPFAFPIFGQNRGFVTVSSNGALYFGRIPQDGSTGLDAGSSVQGLNGQMMIAGMWDDLRTDRNNGDVFVTSDSNRIIFRWKGATFDTPLGGGTTRGENPIEFEIELRADGTVQFRYGSGNTKMISVVGISAGEPDAYLIPSHTYIENSNGTRTLRNLNNAQTVTFTPRSMTPQAFTISGRVADGSGNGIGVTVNLSGTQTRAVNTDANGNYSFANLPAGATYRVTPVQPQYTFSPLSQTFNDLSGNQTANFIAIAIPANSTDNIDFFVRQHYLDFLDREPESGGFDYWTGLLRGCNSDATCLNGVRVEISSRFFAELEFQRTGYYVMRLWRAAYGEFPNYQRFTSDRRLVQNNEASQRAFAAQFVTRAEFLARYPASLTAEQFVTQLYNTTGANSFTAERQAHIQALAAGQKTRADILHEVVNLPLFAERTVLYNAAWVRMQYFGYLRRDVEPQGEAYWTNVINVALPNNYQAMICAFLNSSEYHQRFGTQRGQFTETSCSRFY